MSTISHLETSYSVLVLSEITEILKKWDYETVLGTGYYFKSEKYGHIEIAISAASEYSGCNISWQIDEHHIPHQYRQHIESGVLFFVNHLNALRGNMLPGITISIINGSYHPVDSDIRGYDFALFYAIRNCFDKTFGNLTPANKNSIKLRQENSLQLSKYNATKFSEKQILESLKDLGLNNILRAILNKHSNLIIENHAERFSVGLANLITNDISAEVLENLRLGHIISKYNDITYIGWAHIGVIVKKKEMLTKLGIRNLNSVKGYYDISFM